MLSKQNAEVVCGVGWAVGVWWSGEKCGGAIRSSSGWFLMVAPNRAGKRSSCLYARPSHQLSSTHHTLIANLRLLGKDAGSEARITPLCQHCRCLVSKMRRWWVGWAVEVWWSGEKFGCAIRSSFRWFLMVAPNRAEKRSSCLYARPSHQSTLHPPHSHI